MSFSYRSPVLIQIRWNTNRAEPVAQFRRPLHLDWLSQSLINWFRPSKAILVKRIKIRKKEMLENYRIKILTEIGDWSIEQHWNVTENFVNQIGLGRIARTRGMSDLRIHFWRVSHLHVCERQLSRMLDERIFFLFGYSLFFLMT